MKTKVNIGKKTIYLRSKSFDLNDESEVNVDKLLTIDYRNLLKEVLTFSTALNRLGLLLSEAEKLVKEAELDYRIWYAKERKKVREQFSDPDDELYKARYNMDQVDDEVRSRTGFRVRKTVLFNREKARDYINSIFWSAKGKEDKLTKLSLSLQNTISRDEIDIEDLIGEFNGVELNVRKPLFED